MVNWTLCTLALLLCSSCYQSHERIDVERDAGAPPCRFSWIDRTSGTPATCGIELASRSGCLEAARCICEASGAVGAELEPCIAASVLPRGAITFSDFCTEGPPARLTMAEALEGYLSFEHGGAVRISPECAMIPALLGD